MDQKEVNKQIFKRLEKLEKRVFAKANRHKRGIVDSKTDKKDSLPSIILKLRDSAFFKRPRSVSEVHKKISSIYPCNIDRVDTVLRRLKERKSLRITSKIMKDNKVLAYVW